MCMKETSLMLTLLIPGPRSPAKDIDVYLQPLIKELQELWKGVWTKYAATGTHFQMKAAVLWTINDFPPQSSLSGWSGQGYYACPTCNEDIPSMAVKKKIVYVGYRRFLRTQYPLRSKFKEFCGFPELKPKPRKFTEMDIQLQISKVFKRVPGKHPEIAKKNPKPNRKIELNWSKRSIFWDLEYWPFLLLKNNYDVMHIEKNALEALLNTLLQNDKSKDTLKARQDLQTLGVRKELWLVKKPNGKFEKPHPKYSFTPENRKLFCKFIKGVRLPDGFGSNFKQKVTADDNNITGLKSHDSPIIELCLFFKQLCARSLMQQDMAKAKKQSISIMIELEKIFPPAFFDIMIHVAIHLPDEAILGGPLRYRWMFPFERYMKKLKNYVRNKAKPEGSIAEGYVAEEALTFCSRYLKDDVETRFNRLGRNDDGLPEEEPDTFQVFRSVCKLTGRMKATRLTADVRQAVLWFVLNNSPEIDADILAFREESPDNVGTGFPAWFNHKIREKKVAGDCSEDLFSLACGPISACTYPACIVNGVKFVVHERDILHTTQCSGVSTLGLDGEMYYGQLEEILELTYIGHRKVVLFRCKWFDTINPPNHTTRNRRSYIDRGIHHILTDREFHKNNQYILATQVTQVFYLQDLARQPRGWKVVEHVYHRDVAESDPDVIHGSSSSHVTLSVGLTNVEHTDLSTNDQATEVDAPPVNDDNANANEDNEDDVAAHVLDDDDVVVSDDDEVNPSTNVGVVMACVGPSYHGGDAGGDPPNRPNRPVPTQCQSSMPRIETGSEALRKAYRKNKKQPLPIGFDVTDLGTYHPIGDYSSMLNTLMGETIRPLPFNCEWDEIPKALKAHIFPTLESYFNLAHWYANQEKVVVGDNVYTVGDRVKLGLELKLRVLWRKAKNRIKANHFTRYPSAEVAKNHLPPPSVWEGRTQEEWNELVDWFSHPDQVARSAVNAANRAKNTIPTHQGKKSFAQGRNEYKVEHGHYEDLIETWRKTHSEPKSGRWKSKENKQRYLQMKAMQDQVRGGVIPFMTDQQILDQVVPSENRQNMSGMGRKLPGSGSTSRKHPNKVFADVLTRDEMTQILRQKEQENELLRKQVEEAQQRAYLASLKADASSQWSTAAYQNTQTLYGTLGTFFGHYNSPNYARPFSPHDFNLVPPPPPGPSMPHAPEWAHLLQPPFPTNQPLRPLQPPYPGPFPQPPYPGSFPQPSYNEPFPIPPVNNNTFNNCYHPVYNSTQGIASSSNDPAQRSFYNLVMNPHMTDSRTLDELARDNSLANNDEGASGEEEEEEEGNEGTNDGDYSEENEEEEEGTDGNEE
ncbi:hypothetical protein Tco_1256300 [Tanacetum coccineum]